jgi:peroxiredoxin
LFPAIGEPVPDVEIQLPDGQVQQLSAFVGNPTLLIFLRHLA